MLWHTSRRAFTFEKTLVMGILNVTPDSFSDGGRFFSVDEALKQAEKLIEEGADILDIGGESTRPSSERVSSDEEIRRIVPIINAISKNFDAAISIDTSKSEVARAAIEVGAEIINDVSGLRFDERIAEIAAVYKTGLVLMHLRGDFETMHRQATIEDIIGEVITGLRQSLKTAAGYGLSDRTVALDVGIGFSKTFEQNLELIAKFDKISREFSEFPILLGTSRKSFIGKILDNAPVGKRLFGTLAADAIGVWNGANIVRVHDVKAAVESLKIVEAIKTQL